MSVCIVFVLVLNKDPPEKSVKAIFKNKHEVHELKIFQTRL